MMECNLEASAEPSSKIYCQNDILLHPLLFFFFFFFFYCIHPDHKYASCIRLLSYILNGLMLLGWKVL